MGADIYLNSKFEKNYEEVQKEIDELEALFKSTHKQSLLDVADGEEDKLFELTRPPSLISNTLLAIFEILIIRAVCCLS